jgi:hypothetical protein
MLDLSWLLEKCMFFPVLSIFERVISKEGLERKYELPCHSVSFSIVTFSISNMKVKKDLTGFLSYLCFFECNYLLSLFWANCCSKGNSDFSGYQSLSHLLVTCHILLHISRNSQLWRSTGIGCLWRWGGSILSALCCWTAVNQGRCTNTAHLLCACSIVTLDFTYTTQVQRKT